MHSTNRSDTEILSRGSRILLSISPVEFAWRTSFKFAMSTIPLAKAKRNELQPNALECNRLKPWGYAHEWAGEARPNSRTRTQPQTQLITSYWRKRNTNITISLEAGEDAGRTPAGYQCWWIHNSHNGASLDAGEGPGRNRMYLWGVPFHRIFPVAKFEKLSYERVISLISVLNWCVRWQPWKLEIVTGEEWNDCEQIGR